MKTKVLLGVATGFALGAVLGVLFAPTAGKEMRDKIAQTKDDIQDEITDHLGRIVQIVTDQFQSLKDVGKDLVEETKEKFERQPTDRY